MICLELGRLIYKIETVKARQITIENLKESENKWTTERGCIEKALERLEHLSEDHHQRHETVLVEDL